MISNKQNNDCIVIHYSKQQQREKYNILIQQFIYYYMGLNPSLFFNHENKKWSEMKWNETKYQESSKRSLTLKKVESYEEHTKYAHNAQYNIQYTSIIPAFLMFDYRSLSQGILLWNNACKWRFRYPKKTVSYNAQ